MRNQDNSAPHWGPTLTKISLAGGIGVVIATGLMAGFLGSVPEIRLWLFTALPAGILIGAVLHILRR